MKRYRCHKEVSAMLIAKIYRVYGQQDATLVSPSGEKVSVSIEWDKKHQPNVGGYFVVYEDGYASYSPKLAFETGYSAVQ